MRLPKKVNIGGKIYDVRRNLSKSEGYGRVNTMERVIEVGSSTKNPTIAFETFIHEVIEGSLLENNFRYARDADPDDFFYSMDHTEMSRFADDIACAIRPMTRNK